MRPILGLWLVLIAWAALYLPGLGRPELRGEEGRRILPGLRMLETGDWLLPEMEGQPYLRKPPLINWAVAASTKVLQRKDEWAARLPSAIAVLLLACGAARWGGRMVAGPGTSTEEQHRAGLVLALILLTSASLWQFGRSAEIEGLYTGLSGLAFILWGCAWVRGASSWALWLPASVMLGLAMMAKGPPHLVFFYGLAFAVMRREKDWKQLRHPAFWLGLGVALGPFVLWSHFAKKAYALRAVEAAPAAGRAWFTQLSERFELDKFDLSSWAQVPFESLLLLAPWVIFLIWKWFDLKPLAQRVDGRDQSLLLGWRDGIVVTAVLFLLVPTVRARYLGPLVTPCLILTAQLVLHSLHERSRDLSQKIATGFFALVTIAAIATPWVLLASSPFYDRVWAGMATLIAALALWRTWLKTKQTSQPLRFVLTVAFAGAMGCAAAATTIFPALTRYDDCRPVARAINLEVPAEETLYIFNPGIVPPPLHWRFYLKPKTAYFGKISELPRGTAYVLTITSPRSDADKQAKMLANEKEMAEKLTKRGLTLTSEWKDNLNNILKLYSDSSFVEADEGASEPQPIKLKDKR